MFFSLGNIGDPVVYWILRILTVLTLSICGYLISRKHDLDSKQYWKIAFYAVLVFTLTEGLRYGRGVDYYGYYQGAQGTSVNDEIHDSEPAWLLFLSFFRVSHIYPWLLFVVQSFLLIFSFTRIVKHYPRCAVWAMPLFFFIFGVQGETMVRQDMSLSFLMLAYSFYLDENKKWMYICLALVPLIHFSGFLVVIPFLLLYVMSKNIKGSWGNLLTVVYVLLYFFWNPQYMRPVTDFLMSIDSSGVGGNGSGYLERADEFLLEGGDVLSTWTAGIQFSLLFIVTEFLGNLIIIYYGGQLIKNDRRLLIPYTFSVVAIYVYIIGGHMQLWERIENWYLYMTPLTLGLILKFVQLKKNYIKYLVLGVVLVRYYFYFIKNIGSIPSWGCAFIWDA